MTKRKRRLILTVLLLAVAAAWVALDGRAIAQMRFAGQAHVPSFAKDFKRLPALLPSGESAIHRIHRGLPHPFGEKDEFVHDLWHTPNRSILGYRFYDKQETLSPEVSATLASILARQESYHPYIGPKMCGGYHADFAVMLGDDGKQRWILVCLGCEEVLIRTGDGELICELEPLAYGQLRDAWREHLSGSFELVATRLPVPAGDLERMGYKEYRRTYSKKSFGKNPHLISGNVRGQTIVSVETEPDSKSPRFILFLREETFATEHEAAARISQLRDPALAARRASKGSTTVEQFFSMGTRVYAISSDQESGGTEVAGMLEWLRKYCDTAQPREMKQFE